jgi:hypothetical protein
MNSADMFFSNPGISLEDLGDTETLCDRTFRDEDILECDDHHEAEFMMTLFDTIEPIQTERADNEDAAKIVEFKGKKGVWVTVNGKRIFIAPRSLNQTSPVEKPRRPEDVTVMEAFNMVGLPALAVIGTVVTIKAIKNFIAARKQFAFARMKMAEIASKAPTNLLPMPATEDLLRKRKFDFNTSHLASTFGVKSDTVLGIVAHPNILAGNLSSSEWRRLSKAGGTKGVLGVPIYLPHKYNNLDEISNHFTLLKRRYEKTPNTWVPVHFMSSGGKTVPGETRYMLASSVLDELNGIVTTRKIVIQPKATLPKTVYTGLGKAKSPFTAPSKPGKLAPERKYKPPEFWNTPAYGFQRVKVKVGSGSGGIEYVADIPKSKVKHTPKKVDTYQELFAIADKEFWVDTWGFPINASGEWWNYSTQQWIKSAKEFK